MTIKAANILASCDIIVGYTVYVDLLREHFPQKEFITTPMTKEVARCELAFAQAMAGKQVAVVCSGDAGVYGMSGLMLEIGEKYPTIAVEIIPGVTAALAGGALLGAPLMHDFVVISLSDLLTPWDIIERRLRSAAAADFAICLYNPASKKRHDHLRKACDNILQFQKEETVCGITGQIGRQGEALTLCTLAELRERTVDMFTTVFIGNSQTKVINQRMVTPRGYQI
jgi:precorrin-3B C17-methyltransferase